MYRFIYKLVEILHEFESLVNRKQIKRSQSFTGFRSYIIRHSLDKYSEKKCVISQHAIYVGKIITN